MNSFGQILRFTSFGESHGKAIGGILDGFPAGLEIDYEFIKKQIQRRSTKQIHGSGRQEKDQIEFLSGIKEGISLGSPIAFMIQNTDANSHDYQELEDYFRPAHADDSYQAKYGIRDINGGGRSSARITISLVVAGALVQGLLNAYGISIEAKIASIGGETDSQKQEELMKLCKAEGDSLGGIIKCSIKGLPKGLGEPVFDKFHASLGKAILGINACKGFELGMGFASANMRGSIHNDQWEYSPEKQGPISKNNYAGGLRGGISTAEEVYFRAAFKPIPSIAKEQDYMNQKGEIKKFALKGRHDVCCIPRVLPLVESLAALITADFLLLQKAIS